MDEPLNPKLTDRMLLIDDDPSFGALLQAVSESMGFATEYAPSLMELGAFARIKEFDIAVIDYYLASMRGDEIAGYVDMFFHDIPVVIVSCYAFSKNEMQNWPPCIKRFIPKSAGVSQMVETIRQVLERERLLKQCRNGHPLGRTQPPADPPAPLNPNYR